MPLGAILERTAAKKIKTIEVSDFVIPMSLKLTDDKLIRNWRGPEDLVNRQSQEFVSCMRLFYSAALRRLSSEFIRQYERDVNFLDKIIVMDKAWAFVFLSRKEKSNPLYVKLRVHYRHWKPSVRKVTLMVSMDKTGIILLHAVRSGQNVNAAHYSKVIIIIIRMANNNLCLPRSWKCSFQVVRGANLVRAIKMKWRAWRMAFIIMTTPHPTQPHQQT